MVKTIIIDTDIGYDPDDLFALLLALKLPEVEIALIATADEVGNKRAVFTKMILEMAGRDDIEVVRGVDLGNESNIVVDELIQGKTYAIEGDYVNAIKKVVDSKSAVTYLGIGGFTNLAGFLKAHPDYLNKLEIFMMGGAINYSRHEEWAEHNIKIDKESAKFVLNTGGPISLVMAQTTFQDEYEISTNHSIFKKLKTSGYQPYEVLARHLELFHKKKNAFWPKMHDPLTLATAIGKDFVTLRKSKISIHDGGEMSLDENGKEIYWSDPVSKKKEFMEFLEGRLFS